MAASGRSGGGLHLHRAYSGGSAKPHFCKNRIIIVLHNYRFSMTTTKRYKLNAIQFYTQCSQCNIQSVRLISQK